MFTYYWGAVIVLLPLFLKHDKIISLVFSKHYFLIYAFLISLILFRKKTTSKYLTAIFAYFIFIQFINQYSMMALQPMFETFMLFGAFGLIMQLSCNVNDNQKLFLLNAISVTCLIQSVLIVSNFFQFDINEAIVSLVSDNTFIKYQTGTNLTIEVNKDYMAAGIGSLGNPNFTTSLIAISSASMIRKDWFWFLPMPIISLILINSVSSWLAVISMAVFGFIVLFHRPKLMGVVCLMFISFGLLFWSGIAHDVASIKWVEQGSSYFLNDGGRFEAWASIMDHVGFSLTGNGLGYLYDHFPTIHPVYPIFRQAHNEFIELYVAFGAIGVLLFMLMVFQILKYAKDTTLLIMFCVLMVNSLFNFPLHISPTALIAVVCIGLLLREIKNGIFSNKSS